MKLRKLWALIAGSLFLAGGITLVIVSYQKKQKEPKIVVRGNETIPTKEIIAMIQFYQKTQKTQKISLKELEEALLISPRIQSAKITTSNGRIFVNIQEKKPAFLWQVDTIMEYADDFSLIQENWLESNFSLPFTIPVFYLTGYGNSEKITGIMSHLDKSSVLKKSLTKIITLYKKTTKNYFFLWERISEIKIIRNRRQPLFEIFFTRAPVVIRTAMPFSEELLARLWAVFAYIEQKLRGKTLSIDLDEKHAVIREIS
ncbi:MAG: FtsQ-type POTRA domain-containing protein [Candidatus Hydrogenedentota bacterium]|nr:MAG: FtsQ-type POTRA domain-containing protein [Candidatus Hydrogenedentota bacterium]